MIQENEGKKFDVIIFGAGPAGLAAALKLAEAGKKVAVFEKDKQVGGISKTIEYKNFRFDLGGHRFFSKSKEVNDLWKKTLGDDFLIRPRLSRIYYRNKFFDYPIKPMNALAGLGISDSICVLLSYLSIKFFPYQKEDNFEQWVSNRFGKKLFRIFFKTYTEKLWGIPCNQIQAEWAAQRIKGLSLSSALKNAFFPNKKGKIKTLIDEFQYPKYGPGMMYEKMAKDIEKIGGLVLTESEVKKIKLSGEKIFSITIADKNGNPAEYQADYFLSSMPITELIKRMSPSVPEKILQAANNLHYRSFVTISLILNSNSPFPDTWIYVHSSNVALGRIQNFGNWSPYMLADKNKTALGMEYFCTENDDFWNKSNDELIKIALNELEVIKLGKVSDFEDGFVSRIPKTYPVYDSTYRKNIDLIKNYLSGISNLQPIGRYGMFKYNNMDHSILTGLYAAENILGKNHDIWSINVDEEYHEEKSNKQNSK